MSTGLWSDVGAGSSSGAGAINIWPSSVAAELSSGVASAIETSGMLKKAISSVETSNLFAFVFINIFPSHSCLKGSCMFYLEPCVGTKQSKLKNKLYQHIEPFDPLCINKNRDRASPEKIILMKKSSSFRLVH
jgi:hypothetical protein